MTAYPPGHYAIKRSHFEGYVACEIVRHTEWTVQVANGFGPGLTDTWRKLNVLAIVPPEKIEQVETLLEAAYEEKRQKERAAKVAHQIAVQNILKGYEV